MPHHQNPFTVGVGRGWRNSQLRQNEPPPPRLKLNVPKRKRIWLLWTVNAKSQPKVPFLKLAFFYKNDVQAKIMILLSDSEYVCFTEQATHLLIPHQIIFSWRGKARSWKNNKRKCVNNGWPYTKTALRIIFLTLPFTRPSLFNNTSFVVFIRTFLLSTSCYIFF